VAAPPTKLDTKAVVAICDVLVPKAAVGAVGVPVKEGDAIVARNNISAVFAVMLVVFDAIELVLLVMLVVLEAIKVGKVPMVVELTPPTELIVVVNVPVPLPLASPINVIN
jgi:hypothetical protein